MTQAAAKTGLIPTVLVAIEQNYPKNERIISDHLAYSILPFGIRVFVWFMQFSVMRNWMVQAIEKRSSGVWAGLLCRKRYIDEKLFDLDHDIEAIVNLGAGFDTRIYRMPATSQIPVWEVDQNENISQKHSCFEKQFGQIPSHIQLLSIDFDKEDLSSVLSSNGYSSDQKTFFIWEAVSQFLTGSGIQATLTFLSKAAQGSRLVFTYILRDFLDGENLYGQEKSYEQFVEKGIWLFGLHPKEVSRFLESYGWRVLEHHSYDTLAEKYVVPTGRKLAVLPIERMVLAEKFLA